jgi:hypothetical protein
MMKDPEYVEIRSAIKVWFNNGILSSKEEKEVISWKFYFYFLLV